MAKKDGKYLEKVVALIEKSIDPNATVEHDVQMPVLTSKTGVTKQCDIVIRSGEKPRQIMTICEVQDRTRPMLPNVLDGFSKKMEKVGAQRLICISKKEFSEQCKEIAHQSGGSIVLMTINDWDIDSLPFDFIGIQLSYGEFSLTDFSLLRITASKDEITPTEGEKLNLNKVSRIEKIFSYDKVNFISLDELSKRTVKDSGGISCEGESKLIIDKDDEPQLFMLIKSKCYKVGIKMNFKYRWEIIDVKPHMLSYEQDQYGTLAWYLEANHKLKDDLMTWKIPIIKDGKGFIIGQIHVDLASGDDFDISMSIKKGHSIKNAPIHNK